MCAFNGELIVVERSTASLLHRFAPDLSKENGTVSLGAVLATGCTAGDGQLVVAVHDIAGNPSQFKARVIVPTGAKGPSVRIADTTGTRYPRLGRAGNELLFAWTASDNDQPRVRTARAMLPGAAAK